MAKEVNLSKPKPTQKELLARVTGSKPLSPPPQPKGIKMPPGESLPLPTGKVVGTVNPSSLAPEERDALYAIGWTDDMPIPSSMANIVEEERLRRTAESEADLLPVDPTFKPPPMDTKQLHEVSQEDRDRLRGVLEAAVTQDEIKAELAKEEAHIEQAAAKIPGLREAAEAARKAEHAAEVVDDRAETKKEEPVSQTGAAVTPAFCPHCNHDLSVIDVPEPSYQEKMTFLHALLGQKIYTRDYDLFGGAVTATFRTLTVSEIEIVYKQAWRDQEVRRVLTDIDYWERINRYRLFLQLLSLRGNGGPSGAGFLHELPDGLSKEANPGCTATWKIDENDVEAGETVLQAIEKHIVDNILKTEALFRVVNTACNEFNRLVARLEAMADKSDFWKPTGEQS